MVIVARSFTSKIITTVAALDPPFSVVSVVGASKAGDVETSVVVSGVVPSRRLLVLLDSSNIFSDVFLCVVGIDVVFDHGEELSIHVWPLA